MSRERSKKPPKKEPPAPKNPRGPVRSPKEPVVIIVNDDENASKPEPEESP